MRAFVRLFVLALILMAHGAYGLSPVGTHNLYSPPSPVTDGTSSGSPASHSADGGRGSLIGTAGDSVDMMTGAVVRRETDFSLSVKYGFTFDLTRSYSSYPGAYTGDIRNGDGMFGAHWFCTWETQISDPAGDPSEIAWYDEQGNVHDLVKDSGVWYSKASQSYPYRLDKVVVGMTTTYVLTGYDRSVRVFADDGKIVSFRKDKDTFEDEVITFNYDGSSPRRLTSIDAPGSDDRKLVFTYYSSPYENLVRYVSLEAGAGPTSYLLSTYTYDADKRLVTAKDQGPDPSLTYKVCYEYGTMDSSGDWTGDSGAETPLGRISYYAVDDVSQFFVTAFEIDGTVVSEFAFNPDLANWVKTLVYDFDSDPDIPTVSYGTGMSPPTTAITKNERNDPIESTYSNLTSGTNISPLVATGPGENTPRASYGDDDTEPRLVGAIRGFDGTNYYNVKYSSYESLADTNTLLRFRPASQTIFADPSTSLTTTLTYDSIYPERIAATTSPTDEVTSTTYYTTSTANGYSARIDSVIKGGMATSYTYDSDGLVEDVEDPWGNITSYTYDTRGNALTVTEANGNMITRIYNDFNQVTSETVTNLGTTLYAYSNDAVLTDRATSVPSGEYFLPPRLIEKMDALGKITHYYYDTRGYQTFIVDDDGGVISFNYDQRGRKIEVVNQNSEVSSFDYDDYDRLIAFYDGLSQGTFYTYDEFGRATSEEDQEGYIKSMQYSDGTGSGTCGCSGGGANFVARLEQQDGRFIHKEHDLAGRLTKVWYSANATLTSPEIAAPQLTYTYDYSGRILSVEDTRLGLGSNTYSFEYDSGTPSGTGYLTKITHPEGYTQEYYYDPVTKLPEAYKDVDGYVKFYTYDMLSRLDVLTDGYGLPTTWTYATTMDTSYPVGSTMSLEYGNGTENDYQYDVLGRFDRVDYVDSGTSVMDYVELAYNDVGLIVEKERRDPLSTNWKTTYEYDLTYRLSKEIVTDSSSMETNRLEYTYDAAGNRTQLLRYDNTMTQIGNTGYQHNYRNGVTKHDAHYGSFSNSRYDYDFKGNIEKIASSSTAWFYEWDDDNKMVRAYHKPDVAYSTRDIDYSFVHDSFLKRVLMRREVGGHERTRYFFNGYTEEVTKVSVTSHSDDAFEYTMVDEGDTTSGWSSPLYSATFQPRYDSTRRSGVLQLTADSHADYTEKSITSPGGRVVSFWASATSGSYISVYVAGVSPPQKEIRFMVGQTGTNSYGSNIYTIYAGGGTEYNRVEYDLNALVAVLTPGFAISTIDKIRLTTAAYGEVYFDEMRFSDAMTIEHNTLGAGSIGHILHNRTFDNSTYANVPTDHWFHYDQVGSVMADSDSTGTLVQLHYQDAFGNPQVDWETGLPSASEGWHHNTKNFSPTLGFYQMGQRAYMPEIGQFVSSAPLSAIIESRFGFSQNNPTMFIDPIGQAPRGISVSGPGGGSVQDVQSAPQPGDDNSCLAKACSSSREDIAMNNFTSFCLSMVQCQGATGAEVAIEANRCELGLINASLVYQRLINKCAKFYRK